MVHFTVTPRRDQAHQRDRSASRQGAQRGHQSAEFPDNPDDAYTLAVGFSVATLLGSCGDTVERAHVVDGLNAMVCRTGYALTPVT